MPDGPGIEIKEDSAPDAEINEESGNECEANSESKVSPEKLREIQKYKFIGKGHGLNPEGLKIGDGAQEYLKSLLP